MKKMLQQIDVLDGVGSVDDVFQGADATDRIFECGDVISYTFVLQISDKPATYYIDPFLGRDPTTRFTED